MIEPISKTKLYENVARRITQLIKSGEWSTGSRIPIESDLASLFQVGRSTVREAVKSLQMSGILRSKTGMGTYVSDNALNAISSSELVALLGNEAYLSDLVETRYVLEPQMATLAAKKSNDESVKKLYQIIALMQKCQTKVQLLDQGFQFHAAIAEMTENRILIGFYQSISTQLFKMRDLDFLTLDIYRKGIEDHRSIARAIENKDGLEARQLMRKHLKQDYRQYFEKKL